MSLHMNLCESRAAMKNPGDFCWVRRTLRDDGWQVVSDSEGFRCLATILPGETATTFLPVEPCDEWLNDGVHWTFDGNTEKPTLNPSIDGSKMGLWHGWITGGQMVQA